MAFVCGLNYEGGKIIKHVLNDQSCVAFANVQIRMDAPWLGEVADESRRQSGVPRSRGAWPRDRLCRHAVFSLGTDLPPQVKHVHSSCIVEYLYPPTGS